MRFTDRADAGKQLANALKQYRDTDGIVYALPRGGVVLGTEVARALNLPLDLLIPRKIGHPLQPEYAIGAVTESGEMVLNETEIVELDRAWLRAAIAAARDEARRRRESYLGGHEPASAAGKTAIIVDDGIATGLTMEVAIRDCRRHDPARVVVAVPAAPHDTVARLSRFTDAFVVLDDSPCFLGAVGAYYDFFPQVRDDEVVALLNSIPTQRSH